MDFKRPNLTYSSEVKKKNFFDLNLPFSVCLYLSLFLKELFQLKLFLMQVGLTQAD